MPRWLYYLLIMAIVAPIINLVWGEQFQAGVDVLTDLIAKQPNAAEAYIRLAEAYRKMGHPELEAHALAKLARMKPDFPMIHVLTAQAMLTMDPVDYPKVLTELAAAEKIAPSDPDVFYLRGKALAATKRFREAATALKRATELRPMDPNAYYQLGLTYQRMGETTLAHETLERLRYIRQIATPP